MQEIVSLLNHLKVGWTRLLLSLLISVSHTLFDCQCIVCDDNRCSTGFWYCLCNAGRDGVYGISIRS